MNLDRKVTGGDPTGHCGGGIALGLLGKGDEAEVSTLAVAIG